MGIREILASDVHAGAWALVGCELVAGDVRARIVEVEAYEGAIDPSSHAFRGQTPRNQIMFGPAGFAYIYLNYGIHWMLNVTAEGEGVPGAVLIRAAEPIAGIETIRHRRPKAKNDFDLLNGPGKLAQGLGIDKSLHGYDLFDPSSPVRIEPGEPVKHRLAGPRIGVGMGRDRCFLGDTWTATSGIGSVNHAHLDLFKVTNIGNSL